MRILSLQYFAIATILEKALFNKRHFRRKYKFRQYRERGKMAKSTKKTKGVMPAKKSGRTTKGQTKAGEYVSHLMELHKLQGAILRKLDKEVR